MDLIRITMGNDTLSHLLKSKHRLYGFKAVRNSDAAGRPLVWFVREDYGTVTETAWPAGQYHAYTSTSPIQEGQKVVVGFKTEITLNQSLEVTAGGTGTVVHSGSKKEIRIRNTTDKGYRTGISETLDGTARPVSIFPLYGKSLQKIEPLAQVLLIFATDFIPPGTIIDSTASRLFWTRDSLLATGGVTEGILIDVAKAPNRQAEVGFHIEQGWSWNGVWAKAIAAWDNLVPLLIQNKQP